MPHKAELLMISLLRPPTSSFPLSTHVIAPLSLASVWLSSFILSQPIFADDACTSDSKEGSCTNTETPQDSTTDDTHIQSEPWEGDPSTKPIWWSFSYAELFNYFDCGGILPGYATIYNEGEYIYKVENHTLDPLQIKNLTDMWDQVRTKYKAEVNLSPPGSSEKVVVVPAEIGDAGSDKGRGVFVTEFVPEGTLVINTDSDTIAIFKDGHTWRKFVATLPAYTACNVIEWSWVQDIQPQDHDIRNGLTIFTAWDESNLLNNADWADSEEDPNVRCGTPPGGWFEEEREEGPWGPCRFHYYAIKDLEVGEEILMAYGEFEDYGRDWPRMGLAIDLEDEFEPTGGLPPKSTPVSAEDVIV